MRQKRRRYIAFLLLMVMSLSMVMPNTAEAASKKPAVKSVELRVGGKKVNSKTITVKQSSKTKVQVIVNPSKAKKSVKWAKLSKKSKKIATISGSTIKAGKKNGTVKMTVTVKGKNGKSKKAWLKVKVVKSLPRPGTPATSSTSNDSTVKRTSYAVYFDVSYQGLKSIERVQKVYKEGTIIDLADITHTWRIGRPDLRIIGWKAGNGKIFTKTFKVDGSLANEKRVIRLCLVTESQNLDPKDWHPTFVQGQTGFLALNKIIKPSLLTRSELESSIFNLTEHPIQCACGRKCWVRVQTPWGEVVSVDSVLTDCNSDHVILITQNMKESHSMFAEPFFLDVGDVLCSFEPLLEHGCMDTFGGNYFMLYSITISPTEYDYNTRWYLDNAKKYWKGVYTF